MRLAEAQPSAMLGRLVLDQVSLVVAALAAGAKADSARPAVKDTYDRLKLQVFPVVVTVAEFEQDPDAWLLPLSRLLVDSGAADSRQLTQLAQELLAMLELDRATRGIKHPGFDEAPLDEGDQL